MAAANEQSILNGERSPAPKGSQLVVVVATSGAVDILVNQAASHGTVRNELMEPHQTRQQLWHASTQTSESGEIIESEPEEPTRVRRSVATYKC